MEAGFELGERIELMKRMSETVDADLFEAMSDGRLGGLGLFRVVRRCATCRDTKACAAWLEQAQPGAAAPPAFCRNRALLRGLAAARVPGQMPV